MTFPAAAALVDYRIPQAALSVKLHTVEQIVSGKGYLCDECGFLSDAGSPCEVCMVNAYETMQANAESTFGCDPFARY